MSVSRSSLGSHAQSRGSGIVSEGLGGDYSNATRSLGLGKLGAQTLEYGDRSVESRDTEFRRRWPWPRYKDQDIEDAFQQDHRVRFAGRCRYVLPFMACIALVYMFPFGLKDAHVAWFARVMVAPILLYLMLLWCFVCRCSPTSWLETAVILSLVYTTAASCLTPDRTADLMGWSREDWQPHTFMEAEVIANVCLVIVIAGVMIRVSPIWCFVLAHVVVMIYLIIVSTLGSIEYQLLRDLDHIKADRVWAHILLAARFYIIGLVVYVSRVLKDTSDRESFVSLYKLQQELLEQEDRNDLLMEAREQAAAFEDFSAEVADAMFAVSADPSRLRHGFRAGAAPPQHGDVMLGRMSVKSVVTKANSNQQMIRDYSMAMADRNLTVPRPSVKPLAADMIEPNVPPNARLVAEMSKMNADWSRIRSIAERITMRDYRAREFYEDCLASFPELGLFYCTGEKSEDAIRVSELEYQRTIGALFAVYWLLRLDVDGRESFCFGLDEQWQPMNPNFKELKRQESRSSTASATGVARVASTDSSAASRKAPKLFSKMTDSEKRRFFYDEMPWSTFSGLVQQAGCDPGQPGGVERIMAMLCLTAFHDIMKAEAFIPTVQPEHKLYGGIPAGSKIHDHDLALAYVLEYFPTLLPSFACLPTHLRQAVLFTQGKLRFNHGWFVQAEAPPGAMLAGFKEAVRAGAQSEDIGFYFFHWFTDLAGANATPLGGAEKFVIKFPHSVLRSFIWSVPYLTKLSYQNEVEVVETYLQARWKEMFEQLEVPHDRGAVARMRLACMAQSGYTVIEAFDRLPAPEQRCLMKELSRTGSQDQRYSSSKEEGGPALLVYYSPAFLQQHTFNQRESTLALHVLSRILLAARSLWPLSKDEQGITVTIQVSDLRFKDIEEIVGNMGKTENDERKLWALTKTNDIEGEVVLKTPTEINDLILKRTVFVLLDLSPKAQWRADQLWALRRLRSGLSSSRMDTLTDEARVSLQIAQTKSDGLDYKRISHLPSIAYTSTGMSMDPDAQTRMKSMETDAQTRPDVWTSDDSMLDFDGWCEIAFV